MPTLEERRAKKKQLAEQRKVQLESLTKKLATLEETTKQMEERLKAADEKNKILEGFDVKQIIETIESLKSQQNTIRESIRRDKGGFYVPGIEDEAADFSVIRAVAGSATGWWMFKDTKEHEIVKAATEVARNVAGIDSEGGYFVPDQVIPDVIGALYQESVLINLNPGDGTTRVSLITGLNSPKVRIPKFKSGMIAYWIGERKRYTESQPDVGVVTMDAKKLGIAATMTEEMVRFSSFGFDSLFRNDMRRVAAEEVDRVLLYGSGTAFEPRGLINHPKVRQFYHETGSTTAPSGTPIGGRSSWSRLNSMQLALEEARVRINSSAAWISSPRFFRDIANLRTLNFSGQNEETAPFLAALPPLTMAALRDLVGDFDHTTIIPSNRAIAGSGAGQNPTYTDLFYGNWAEYIVGRWGGIEVLEDQGLAGENFWHDQRSVKMRLYIDAAVRHDESLLYSRDVRTGTNPA